jgi:hypothetical protein
MITLRHTLLSRTPLDEWSARRIDLSYNIQHLQKTNIRAPGGIRTHNPCKRAAADPRLRPRGHWDRPHVSLGGQYLPIWRPQTHPTTLRLEDGSRMVLRSAGKNFHTTLKTATCARQYRCNQFAKNSSSNLKRSPIQSILLPALLVDSFVPFCSILW